MDVDTKLDMVKDPTSGTDNYISQFVFESCEMRHEKREKRYFSIIVLLIVLLVATNVAWLFYEAQFQVQTSETVTTTTTQTVDATQETANGGWQATQQLYQPQTNSFMPKAQNPAESLYMELENCDYDMVYIAEIQPDYRKKIQEVTPT